MQKKIIVVVICCMMFVLCGCGITQFFQKNNPKDDLLSEGEKNTQYDIATEVESGTEIEIGTEVGTEVEMTTEVVGEAEDEKTTEANTQTATNSQEKENTKKEPSKEETPKKEATKEETVKEETPKVETPKVETPKEETPTVETPKVESSETESESTTTTPARGAYLVENNNLSGARLAVGDGMYNISVTTVTGETVKISDVLKTKDMILLNFWASWCGPCLSEFPHMSDAYDLYNADVEVIALDIETSDSESTIKQFCEANEYKFKVGLCSSSWLFAFNSNSIPTTVIIDRYGMICEIKVGAIPSVEGFTSIFERYIGDDYQPAY